MIAFMAYKPYRGSPRLLHESARVVSAPSCSLVGTSVRVGASAFMKLLGAKLPKWCS